jgi:hypothetical protein
LDEATRTLIEKESELYNPKIEKIPLVAYLRNPDITWRAVSEHGLAAQSLDPGDASLLAGHWEVDWNQALQLFHLMNPQQVAKMKSVQNSTVSKTSSQLDRSEENAILGPILNNEPKANFFLKIAVLLLVIILGTIFLKKLRGG